MSGDPVASLLAWCSETERVARAATQISWTVRNLGRHDLSAVVVRDGAPDEVVASLGPTQRAASDSLHIARHDPASVLAQVAAVRAVVGLHASDGHPTHPVCPVCGVEDGSWPCTTLLELADGFTPTWRTG